MVKVSPRNAWGHRARKSAMKSDCSRSGIIPSGPTKIPHFQRAGAVSGTIAAQMISSACNPCDPKERKAND